MYQLLQTTMNKKDSSIEMINRQTESEYNDNNFGVEEQSEYIFQSEDNKLSFKALGIDLVQKFTKMNKSQFGEYCVGSGFCDESSPDSLKNDLLINIGYVPEFILVKNKDKKCPHCGKNKGMWLSYSESPHLDIAHSCSYCGKPNPVTPLPYNAFIKACFTTMIENDMLYTLSYENTAYIETPNVTLKGIIHNH